MYMYYFHPDLLTKTTFAVPAFHAYGHDVACQVAILIFWTDFRFC